MTDTRVKAEKMQIEETQGRKFGKVRTYDEETGYYVTSVFPVLEENALREQAVTITEEMIRLMKENTHSENKKSNVKKVDSGTCNFRKHVL